MSTTDVGCFMPRNAATGEVLKLALQRLWLGGQVLPAGARLTVQHVFQSEEDSPLEVIYAFSLPRDAAMRAFRIIGDGVESHSELRPTEDAVKEYEQGITQGNLSALARQYGDGVVNLTVGNIRPKETVTVYLEILAGVELRDDGFRFRFPFALAPTYHASAKYSEQPHSQGEIELPAALFGDVILPRFQADATALHQVGFELTITGQLQLAELGSPSHAVRVKGNRVMLAPEKDVPNRDLILDATYAKVEAQVLSGKGHYAAVIPSASFGSGHETPRRIVILLDHSGSMEGPRLTQATRAIEACLGALSDRDQFGLVAFSTHAQSFRDSLLEANRAHRDQARDFLRKIAADGGTELANGLQRAVQVLGPGGGDAMIFTDGEVSGTEAILSQARAAGIRLHCLGIGDASQDRFIAQIARETGGVSRYVATNERVDIAAVDLFASVGRPVASGLKTQNNVQPPPPTAVFSGTPVLLFGEGEGALELEWDGGGRLHVPIAPGDESVGETVRLLQGSRLITDWESRYPASEAVAPLDKRKESRVAARLLELSRAFGLASREMSLVAVVKRSGDRPGELPETRVVSVGTSPGAGVTAYFKVPALMRSQGGFVCDEDVTGFLLMPFGGVAPVSASEPPPPLPSSPAPRAGSPRPGIFSRLFDLAAMGPRDGGEPEETSHSPADLLIQLASQLEGDGGLAGRDTQERAGNTIVALLAFLSQGHTRRSGAFRSHVDRMVKFLASVGGLDTTRKQLIDLVVDLANRGAAPPPGDWLLLAGEAGGHWREIETALRLPPGAG